MTNKKIYSIIEEQEQYKNIKCKKIVKVRMYSRDRLVFAGIDLLHLQNAISSLPDKALEAVSQYGYDKSYDKNALEFAIVILSEKLKLTIDY